MSPLQTAEYLDLQGDVRADAWPAWIKAQAEAHGWIGKRGGVNTERIAQDTGFAERTVERWLAGTLTPDLGVRRAIQRAWAAPIEAEAMRHLRAALAALQRPTEASRINGGGGADGSATRKDAERSPPPGSGLGGSPSPPPPSLDPLILEAMKEYGVDEDTARAMLEGA